MTKAQKIVLLSISIIILIPAYVFSGQESNYLILQDISGYKFMGKGGGKGSGIISATGHFGVDHIDESFGGLYFNEANEIGVKVEVTKHSGSDSDKWLLHEVEDIFRSNRKLGELISGTEIREINGNRIFNWISYAWISGNVVVYITWTPKPEVQNPEPLEVVRAYLQKFPSTIPATLVLDRAHDEKWIKDEMERRLWLCDKWFLQLQKGKAELDTTLKTVVDHMNVFLDYREKYYGIKALDEKKLLWDYLSQKDGTAIKNKLAEYKKWWNVNKGKTINLP